jgi:hypothetical protein
MQLIKDPDGDRFARIEYTAFGISTGRLILSELTLADMKPTSCPAYYRHGQHLYLRVRVVY